MDKNEKVEYWIGLADYDIDAAKAMLNANKYLYVGFMCHQTIEKALKAVIARDCTHDEIPPKIHHLVKLSEKAVLFNLMTDEQKNLVRSLNPLNTEARYPEYKERISANMTSEICRALIEKTEGLLCWIKSQL